MPRLSAEARMATAFRAGAKPPQPPRDLGPAAAAVWRSIMQSKPLGFFDSSLPQLAVYCRIMATLDRISAELEETPPGTERSAQLVKEVRALGSVVAVHGRQLRITNTARIDRKAGILDEAGPGRLLDDDLLGGRAVWGRRC
jgi:hypothetical protein